MSCNVKIKSLEYLESKGAMKEARVVDDYTKFQELNKALTDLAYTKYGVGDNNKLLFKTESKYVRNLDGSSRYLLRVEPNEELFSVLQTAVDNYQERHFESFMDEVNWDDITDEGNTAVVFERFVPPNVEEEVALTNTMNEYLLFGESKLNKGGLSMDYAQSYNQMQSVFPDGLKDIETEEDEALYNKLQNELDEFDAKQKQYNSLSALEVLNNIIKNYQGFTEEAGDLIDKALFLLEKTKANVNIVPLGVISGRALMDYDHITNSININLEKLNRATTRKAVESFLHEVVHSVTVNAYYNPQTLEQEMFKEFIDEAYNHYIEKTKNKQLYGYNNPLEFISEIFVNPTFQEDIKAIEAQENSKLRGFWKKLIANIRRIFGLDLGYQSIIERIVDISDTEQVGDVSKARIFEQTAAEEIEAEIEKDYGYDLTTTEKKLIYNVKRMDKSMELSIKSLRSELAKAETDEELDKMDFLKKQIDVFNEVRSSVNSYKKENQILAIQSYAELMLSNLTSVQKQLKKINDSSEESHLINALKRYRRVTSAYSIVRDVQKFLADLTNESTQTIIPKEDLNKIRQTLAVASGIYNDVEIDLESLMRIATERKLNNISYFPNIEKKHFNRLAKEHAKRQLPSDKTQWIINTMQGRDKDLIEQDLALEVTKLLDSPSWDIYSANVLFNSAINTSAPFIQILNKMLLDIDNERIEDRIAKDIVYKQMHEELVAEKGTNNINKLYENIKQQDSEGRWYFKGEYDAKFYSDVHGKLQTIRKEAKVKIDKLRLEMQGLNPNSQERRNLKKKVSEITRDKKSKEQAIMSKNLNKISNKKYEIKSKWKNDFSGLSKTEKKVLAFLIQEQDDIRKMTHYPSKGESNIKWSFGGVFYSLPKVTKSDAERLWSGTLEDKKGIITDKFTEISQTRSDDVGYREKLTDLSGKEIHRLKLWYRDPGDNFNHKNQSLDLMTISRLDYIQAKAFQVRSEAEDELNFLVDIAKSKSYHEKTGSNVVISKLFKKYNIIQGETSNTYRMMKNLMEQKFYDRFNKQDTKFGPVDVNKAVSFINQTNAFMTLTFNIASATANVLNANTQLFLESFIKGNYIKAEGIAKANAIYANDLPAVMRDITNPINRSFVNQVNEMFNIRGLFNLADADFIKSSLLKAGFSTDAFRILHESGEHWVQSVTTMAVLDGIKVLNEQGNFINKDGNEVKTIKEAASLLDMLKVDEIDGIVELDEKVVYTTHSRMAKWNENGKSNVDLLIRKMLDTIVGNYRQTDQPDVFRYWLGQLGMLYRKFLVPIGTSRLRGFETSYKRKEDLEEHEQRFSYALQEYEEGSYTTFVRYVITSIKEKQFFLFSKERIWDDLTDYEKHNIHKTIKEIIVAKVLLPLITLFLQSAADGDKEYMYFLAYQTRRLETELSQYFSITEFFKMMRSPIPSARILETSLNIFGTVFLPWNWHKLDDNYDDGRNKFFTRFKKQVPVIKEFERSYQDLFQFQNSSWGTGI